MAVASWTHFRFAWGLIDFATDSESPAYVAANTDNNIPVSTFGRRCVVTWDRSGMAEDRVQTHFDFINLTAGHIDESWIDADFTAIETALDTWWGALKSNYSSSIQLSEYRWYRLGPGATPPEAAVRIAARAVSGTNASSELPGQVAACMSLRTALRKQWGRIYLPGPTVGASQINPSGRFNSAFVDGVAGAAATLEATLSTNDFEWVVYSKLKQRAYTVQRLWMDDSPDTIRRRKLTPTYHKVYGA